MFHVRIHVVDESRSRYATSLDQTVRDRGVPSGTPHLQFTSRMIAFTWYMSSVANGVDWFREVIEPCMCEDAVLFTPTLKQYEPEYVPNVVRDPQPVLTRAQRLALQQQTI